MLHERPLNSNLFKWSILYWSHVPINEQLRLLSLRGWISPWASAFVGLRLPSSSLRLDELCAVLSYISMSFHNQGQWTNCPLVRVGKPWNTKVASSAHRYHVRIWEWIHFIQPQKYRIQKLAWSWTSPGTYFTGRNSHICNWSPSLRVAIDWRGKEIERQPETK